MLSFNKVATFLENPGRNHLLANMAMMVTVLLWGVSFISIKVAVSEVPPITMALIRFMIASAILFFLVKKLESTAKIKKQDRYRVALAGFLGVTLYFIFENKGVKLSTATNAALITSIVPVIATTLDMFIFKTKTSWIKFCGLLMAFVGSYLAITANGQVDFSSSTFKGNILLICSMVSWTCYTLYSKSLHDKYSGLVLITYQNFFGTLLLIPPALTEYSQWRMFSLVALSNIIFLAVFCSAVCYFLYIFALKRLDVAVTTLYLNLVPIVGVIGGHYILLEVILPSQLLGGILIISAIGIVNLNKLPFRKASLEAANELPKEAA